MPPGFYTQPVLDLASSLIGCTLLVDGVGGIIVETEAYHPADPASHSFAGPTPRYRIYGLHWCLNLVGGSEPGAAVLLRALQPTHGITTMQTRRNTTVERNLCAGPGKLAQALAVTAAHDGLPLDAPPFALLPRDTNPPIATGRRVGITKAADEPWRFGWVGSPYLSRPFP